MSEPTIPPPKPEEKDGDKKSIPEGEPTQSPELILAATMHQLSQHAPKIVEVLHGYIREKEKTQRRLHYATVALCALIVITACVIGWRGNTDSAERIILPLITFLGGLLVGEKAKGFFS